MIQMVLQQSLLARQDACAIRILQTGSDFNNWWSIHEVLIDGYPVGSSDDASGPVQIRKQIRQGFAVGSDDGAGNRQYVFLVPENNNDINQLWIEIDRGSGFSLAKK